MKASIAFLSLLTFGTLLLVAAPATTSVVCTTSPIKRCSATQPYFNLTLA
jgi:hypothetical protein